MNALLVIPARYGSTRFPGKPLALVCGHSLLKRVWSIARHVNSIKRVVVATDNEVIAKHAQSFGAEVVMTRPECRNGTERVYETVQRLNFKGDVVVNLQGDSVLTPPWVLDALVAVFSSEQRVNFATPASQLNYQEYLNARERKQRGDTTGTFVTFAKDFSALYFSKSLIPNLRNPKAGDTLPVYKHIGVYAYRPELLKRYLELDPSALEQAEELEQLRALEHGIPIQVVPVDYRGRSASSIDTPEDIGIVEAIIRKEGELVQL